MNKTIDFPSRSSVKKCEDQHGGAALANYTNWLQERQAIHNRLLEKLQRKPGDFLMNFGDQLNQVNEEKAALEYTRIPQEFDRYRGNPEWWEAPPGLHGKCRCRRDELIYRYVKTKVQKNEIPEIEKVGTPMFIRNEKMLHPKIRSVYKQWQDSSYRKERVKELSSLLENVEPHKPEFEKLMIVGRNTPPENIETQTVTTVPKISRSYTDGKKESSVYDFSLKCCLKINGCFFYENSPSLSTSHKFNVFFDYDVKSHPLQRKFIVFENVGRVTVRILWRKLEKFRIFREFVDRKNTEYFCFDKNMLILVPGQIMNLPVWFRSNKIKTVVETWEVVTVPKYWPETIKVFFVFQAQTCIENFKERIRNIKAKIDHRVKRRMIKEVLEDLTRKTKYEDHKPIDYSYYEPELFEAMNMDGDDTIPRPKYQYEASVVEDLKQFYSEVRLFFHPKTWNLKVQDLLVMARVKDIIEYAELRTYEFGKYRSTIGSKSGTVVGKETKSSVSDLKIKIKTSGLVEETQRDSFVQKETKYGKLMKILWTIAPPSITPNRERLKYFQVYSILNAYFTLMSSELEEIKPFHSNQTVIRARGDYENCRRLVFDEFDDTQLLRTKTSWQDVKAQPKPEALRDVSTSDVHTLHKLYFGVEPEDVTGKHGKKKLKQVDSKSSKPKLSRSSLHTTQTGIDEKGLVNSDFDPYEDFTEYSRKLSTKPSTPEEYSRKLSTKSSAVEGYSRKLSTRPSTVENTAPKKGEDVGEVSKTTALNIYVAIYSNLSDAVDAVVDTLESMKEYRVPLEDIEKLKTCFKLHIEEEVAEEETQINPFTNPEERDYFEKILKAHLNEVTGKYLVCAETEQVALKNPEDKGDTVCPPDAPSVFSIYKRESDETLYEERGQQTQPFESVREYDLLFTVGNREQELFHETGNSENSYSGNFYYSDDEVFENFEGGGKNVVSEESQVEIDISNDDSKPISLIDEWEKKRGSK